MIKQTQQRHRVILYDDALVSHPDAHLFDPAFWQANGYFKATVHGRGSSWMVGREGAHWVLRHYRRGGMMRWANDRYLWPYGGVRHTRPMREWRYMFELFQAGLPVARPVAAHVRRRGSVWRGDLITVRLASVTPLSAWLQSDDNALDVWAQVGRVLARFHAAGAMHPDLNAHNILIGPDRQVSLIDFDGGRWCRPHGRWAVRNVQRLHRSVVKLSGETRAAQVWPSFLAGYDS